MTNLQFGLALSAVTSAVLGAMGSCAWAVHRDRTGGPGASAVAHSWLGSLSVDYETVACRYERTGDPIEGPWPSPCYVRLANGGIATIICENTYVGAAGCVPFNANDQLLLAGAFRSER